MGSSKSETAKVTLAIIAPITNTNVLDINLENAATQARNANKLEDQNIGKDSISDDRTLIITIITYSLNLFTCGI